MLNHMLHYGRRIPALSTQKRWPPSYSALNTSLVASRNTLYSLQSFSYRILSLKKQFFLFNSVFCYWLCHTSILFVQTTCYNYPRTGGWWILEWKQFDTSHIMRNWSHLQRITVCIRSHNIAQWHFFCLRSIHGLKIRNVQKISKQNLSINPTILARLHPLISSLCNKGNWQHKLCRDSSIHFATKHWWYSNLTPPHRLFVYYRWNSALSHVVLIQSEHPSPSTSSTFLYSPTRSPTVDVLDKDCLPFPFPKPYNGPQNWE